LNRSRQPGERFTGSEAAAELASCDGFAPDPTAAIRFRTAAQGPTREDFEPLIGTRTRAAEVSSRKRSLSIGMIRRLHDSLGISAEVLIRPSRKGKAA